MRSLALRHASEAETLSVSFPVLYGSEGGEPPII
jgi:hypothetical protein